MVCTSDHKFHKKHTYCQCLKDLFPDYLCDCDYDKSILLHHILSFKQRKHTSDNDNAGCQSRGDEFEYKHIRISTGLTKALVKKVLSEEKSHYDYTYYLHIGIKEEKGEVLDMPGIGT